jgi:arylsulfatase A-like enzyme
MATRREFLAGAAGAAMPLPGARPEPRPNVLFIAIDDLNNWIGCLGGHPDVKTPNLDRLAARGVLFTRAHCAAPVCNPSRAALLTGVRPSVSGVYENQQPFRESLAGRNAITLPQHFMDNGYRVTGAGKIFHSPFPDPQSWHDYFPSQKLNKPDDPRPDAKPANGIPGSGNFDWGPLDVRESGMGDWKVTEWVRAQLARRADRPFFLACGIYRPHLPWFVPRRYFDLYDENKVTLPEVNENDLDDVPAEGRRLALRLGDHARITSHNAWRKAVRAYLAAISFADAMVGRVVEALDDGPNAEDTTVVLWSDHGWHLGQKLHWRKFALWEEATHNVLMMAAPGMARPGGRSERVVSLMDIYPTLIDLCGLRKHQGTEGRSLRPLLRRPDAKWPWPALTTYLRGNHSVRDERWRYIRYHDGGEELYDHQTDRLEWTNLAHKPELRQVKDKLARWLPKSDALDSPGTKLPPGADY